jgi:hypothetical protein
MTSVTLVCERNLFENIKETIFHSILISEMFDSCFNLGNVHKRGKQMIVSITFAQAL